MKIKRFNENLSYTDFFGKEITHDVALKKRIQDFIIQIMIDEFSISEKDFTKYDEIIKKVRNVCDENPEIYKKAEQFYWEGKRLQWCAEIIYFDYFLDKNIKMH